MKSVALKQMALALVLSGSGPAAWAAQGTLTPVQGAVEFQRADQIQWETISAPTPVQEGDRIQTGPGAKAFLVTPRDHRIAIGPETQVSLDIFTESQTKLDLQSGSVRSKVRKLQVSNGESFKVQTPAMVVAVRGTDFSVVQMDRPRVHVFEGLVDLASLKKDIGRTLASIEAGRTVEMDPGGQVQTLSKPPEAPSTQERPKPKEKPSAWWESPDNMKKESDLFMPQDDLAKKPDSKGDKGPGDRAKGKDDRHPHGPPPPPPGNGFQPLNPPPIPPGNGGTGGNAGSIGLQALIDTMRSKNLHEQANSILVADLYQQNAVRTDPLTGQLRQYADAIQKVGPDGIRFINATMMPNVPDSLNTTVAETKFNTALPADYWTATKTAFAADATPPAYYAVEYHSVMSNTIDFLRIDATGGSSVLNISDGLYETVFANMSTQINGTTLWSKTGSTYFFRGGSAPTKTQNSTGIGDIEVKETYADGTFFSIRDTFANDMGQIASATSKPSALSAGAYLDSLQVRTTIRSNLFVRGSLDIYGSARARTLSGHLSYDNFDAADILAGLHRPYGAPMGFYNQ